MVWLIWNLDIQHFSGTLIKMFYIQNDGNFRHIFFKKNKLSLSNDNLD